MNGGRVGAVVCSLGESGTGLFEVGRLNCGGKKAGVTGVAGVNPGVETS